MVRKRYLDSSEVRLADWAAALIVSYKGKIDRCALRGAFEIMRLENPILRAVVERRDNGYLLTTTSHQSAYFTVLADDQNEWLLDIGRNWDCTRNLARLVLMDGGDEGAVALFVDHSIADGRRFKDILFRLWQMFGEIVRGRSVSIECRFDLPESSLTVLNRAFDNSAYVPGSPGAPTSRGSRELLHVDNVFSEDATTSVIRAARKSGTTVTSVVAGAILCSHRRIVSTEDGPVGMRCDFPIDLRPRIPTVEGADDVTYLVGGAIVEVSVPGNPSVINLANEIGHSLEEYARGLDAKSVLRTYDSSISMPPHPQRVVLVTNTGVFNPLPNVPGIEVTDITTRSYTATLTYAVYSVYTYLGRLHVNGRYPATLFTRAQAEQLRAEVYDRLACLD